MIKHPKKYISFVFYVAGISVPVLYWINFSWGISVLFNFKVFLNLVLHDIAFLFTVVSVIGALIIGFFSIIVMKENIQTEQDIYDDRYIDSSVSDTVSDGDLFDTQVIDNSIDTRPPVTIFNFSNENESFKIDRENFSASGVHTEKEPIMSFSYDEEKHDNLDSNYFDNILKSKGYRTFDVKIIDGFNILFFAISNKNILFGYNMPFVGEIIANESMADDSALNHPLWFSHMHRFISPIFAVKEVRKVIDDLLGSVLPKDHDITIESYCILDDKAIILNLNDVKKNWDKDFVNVVMKSKAYKTIPAFTEVLEDNSTSEILPSFVEFAKTLEQYFIQKARIFALKKA